MSKKTFKPCFKTEILPIFFIMVSLVVSGYFYLNFPEQVPTHWDIHGQVDGWSSKGFAAFFFPILILGMYFLFIFLPKIDPKREKYQQFMRVYNIFKNLIVIFMVGVYLLTGLNGLGYNLPIELYMPVAVGILFIIIGNYMSKIKTNWFLGIRTPWTMSSDIVWQKTHRFGGKIFVLSGLILASMVWLPDNWQSWLFSLIIVLMIFGTFGYSYWVYKQEEKRNSK